MKVHCKNCHYYGWVKYLWKAFPIPIFRSNPMCRIILQKEGYNKYNNEYEPEILGEVSMNKKGECEYYKKSKGEK